MNAGILHVWPDVVQGTDEWSELRRGVVTASEVSTLVTAKTLKPAANIESRSLTAMLVAERITGYTDPTYVSDDIVRGWEDESRATDVYGQHYAPVAQMGFMLRDWDGFTIGYSPDGLVGEDGLVEVKSRRPKKHLQTILADAVPPENMAQCQAGLLVSGRQWLDYVSYCGGMPLYVKRVYPTSRWFDAITEAVENFEDAARVMVGRYRALTNGLPETDRIPTDLEMVI